MMQTPQKVDLTVLFNSGRVLNWLSLGCLLQSLHTKASSHQFGALSRSASAFSLSHVDTEAENYDDSETNSEYSGMVPHTAKSSKSLR